MDQHLRELLNRFVVDQDHVAFEDLHEAVRPLVASVCRARLREQSAVEDAVQTTLLKLVENAGGLHGSVTAWLVRTAKNACVDRIRRDAAQSRRAATLVNDVRADSQEPLTHARALAHLQNALAAAPPDVRHLLIERFIKGQRLADLAARSERSVASLSRDISRAVEELACIFQSLDQDGDHLPQLRWNEEPLAYGLRNSAVEPLRPTAPGWTRPIRIGVLVSYASFITPNFRNDRLAIASQAVGLDLALDPRFDLIALVEPDTSHLPVIERHIRDRDVSDGILDASDGESLKTLDVIWFGKQWIVLPAVTAAIRHAVERGAGLLSVAEKSFATRSDPNLNALLLARERPHHCCTGLSHGDCYRPLPATVHHTHPALPGLRAGAQVQMDGCTTWANFVAGAKPLISFDAPRPPSCNCDQCRGTNLTAMPTPPPVLATGSIGRGRALVLYTNHLRSIIGPKFPGNTVTGMIEWLAEPRRS